MRVRNLKIREIFATTGKKTLEVEVETLKTIARSSVPIGTSVGRHEVFWLPVEEAIKKFLLIRRQLRAQTFENIEEVDRFLRILDKSVNFREIGGNLALAISSAFLKAFAIEEGKEVFEYLLKEEARIPLPVCNIVGGWKEQSDIQEFLLLPLHQKSFLDTITTIAKAYEKVGKALKEKDLYFVFAKNIESAWITFLHFEEILKILTEIANENFLRIGLDFAASQIWDGNYYNYLKTGERLTRTEQISFVENLAKKYPISYIEDPFHEDDFVSFSVLTHRLKPKLIVGDDLIATNLERLKQAIEQKAVNAVIIKPNQVGTISDTIKVIEEAKKNKIATVISHRSGETEDTLICHLAVGLGCDYIKLGISGERTVKINEMIRIEEKLKS